MLILLIGVYFDFRKTFNAEMTDKGLDGVANQECAAKVLKEHDTIENIWNSFIHNRYSAITQPAIDANEYELEPALITMVQQNQFAGHSTENPNEHLGRFLRIANSIKLSGVKPEVIQLQLFPFSLRDMAITWFNSLPHESVNTWEELMRAYFSKFFIPSLPSKQRREITNSKHEGDENRYIAWRDLAGYNIRSSGSSERNDRAEENKMKVMDKLSAIEAKLDELTHLMNERKSNQRLKTKQNCRKNE